MNVGLIIGGTVAMTLVIAGFVGATIWATGWGFALRLWSFSFAVTAVMTFASWAISCGAGYCA